MTISEWIGSAKSSTHWKCFREIYGLFVRIWCTAKCSKLNVL